MFWTIYSIVTAIKFLLIPSYRSTDFEVHRNWLAITHSLPISKWYFEETSEWTLDYPPMFAYFEYILSQFAVHFDPKMLVVSNLNYASENTILFQRLSVMVTDVVFAFGAKRCIDQLTVIPKEKTSLAFILLANFGLLIIDHIHFQYNGILFGILLLSIAFILEEKFLQSAFLFAILLNMKHIFIYVSPVFIVYLFRFYCLKDSKNISQFAFKLLKLGAVVIGVTLVSFGPFYDHIPQVLSRLFPFKRGLCHAYWAPNAWALYNIADKAGSIIFGVKSSGKSNTGGLVQEYEHNWLPAINPSTTFIITAIAMLPCVAKLFFEKYDKQKTPKQFIRSVVICACASFMFGWHVHEKAILMVLIPLSLLAFKNQTSYQLKDKTEASQLFFLSIITNYSLLPLLFPANLIWIKLSLCSVYLSILGYSLRTIYLRTSIYNIFNRMEWLYMIGFFGLLGYEHCIQYVINFNEKLPFLQLLLISVYCSIGVIYFWLSYYINFIFSFPIQKQSTKSGQSKKKRKNEKKFK